MVYTQLLWLCLERSKINGQISISGFQVRAEVLVFFLLGGGGRGYALGVEEDD